MFWFDFQSKPIVGKYVIPRALMSNKRFVDLLYE